MRACTHSKVVDYDPLNLNFCSLNDDNVIIYNDIDSRITFNKDSSAQRQGLVINGDMQSQIGWISDDNAEFVVNAGAGKYNSNNPDAYIINEGTVYPGEYYVEFTAKWLKGTKNVNLAIGTDNAYSFDLIEDKIVKIKTTIVVDAGDMIGFGMIGGVGAMEVYNFYVQPVKRSPVSPKKHKSFLEKWSELTLGSATNTLYGVY